MARILRFAAAAAVAVVGARLLRREWLRVNADLERVRARGGRPVTTLKRDKTSGEWRPSH